MGEPLLLVTDHYRVKDWNTLTQALSNEPGMESCGEQSWARIFEGADGLLGSSLNLDPCKRPDQIKVSDNIQKYADKGQPWFEAVAGNAVAFISRELSDSKGMLANS